MNDNGSVPLKKMIIQALEDCTDIDLLYFVYKMIIYETQGIEPQNNTATD